MCLHHQCDSNIFLDIEVEEALEASGEEGMPVNSDDNEGFLDDAALQPTPVINIIQGETLLDECQEITEYVDELTKHAQKKHQLEASLSPEFLPGSQNQLIAHLLQAQTLKDDLIFAFVILTARNWVYLQCSFLNQPLRMFLSTSTVVIKCQGKAILEEIPFDEQATILHMEVQAEANRGLLVLKCKYRGVEHAIMASIRILGLFNQSQHPMVLEAMINAPCPTEWHFAFGELVRMTGRPKHNNMGTIIKIREKGLEIMGNDESGTHYCPFLWAEKIFYTGDYVHCIDNGREGFIQSMDNFSVSLLEQHDDGRIDAYRNSAVIVGHEADPVLPSTEHIINVNCLFLQNSETHLNFQCYGLWASQSSDDMETYRHTSGRTPWIRLQVVVHSRHHPLQTKIGTVRDVICGQKNESGLAVIIILDNYDLASTNKEYAVDYADVLDMETGHPLHFIQPLKPSQKDFMLWQSFLASRCEEQLALARQAIRSQPLISHRPDTPPSTEPAWDPHSKMPPPYGFTSHAGPPLLPSSTYEHHGHWMTDPRLADSKVMVIQKRSDGAGMQAYIRKGKKKLEPIQPGMAEAMHPAMPQNYE
ncbi:hypothetical protein IW262DRAFT_1293637 [Armillaria fumosa]|nr:hypothetical protein IW262DRAFT_1293637 [Armillaria fumosa]